MSMPSKHSADGHFYCCPAVFLCFLQISQDLDRSGNELNYPTISNWQRQDSKTHSPPISIIKCAAMLGNKKAPERSSVTQQEFVPPSHKAHCSLDIHPRVNSPDLTHQHPHKCLDHSSKPRSLKHQQLNASTRKGHTVLLTFHWPAQATQSPNSRKSVTVLLSH